VVIQADGKILAEGEFGDAARQYNHLGAVRVNPDGSVDTGYGNGGWASAPFGNADVQAIALEPDGRLLLAGIGYPIGISRPKDVFLVRFLGSAPQVGSFTASPNPVPSGGSTTLTASNITDGNPGATVTQVAFYLDSNGDGVLDAGDTLLGDGSADGLGNWLLNVSTAGWSATDLVFAQAEDSDGVFGDPDPLTLTVQ
jgi:hypothetical protein